MNWRATQHDSRLDGHGRSYGGRVAQAIATMSGRSPQFVAIDCAGKPVVLEGLSWESPG